MENKHRYTQKQANTQDTHTVQPQSQLAVTSWMDDRNHMHMHMPNQSQSHLLL